MFDTGGHGFAFVGNMGNHQICKHKIASPTQNYGNTKGMFDTFAMRYLSYSFHYNSFAKYPFALNVIFRCIRIVK